MVYAYEAGPIEKVKSGLRFRHTGSTIDETLHAFPASLGSIRRGVLSSRRAG
jgi:hypothetical protein